MVVVVVVVVLVVIVALLVCCWLQKLPQHRCGSLHKLPQGRWQFGGSLAFSRSADFGRFCRNRQPTFPSFAAFR